MGIILGAPNSHQVAPPDRETSHGSTVKCLVFRLAGKHLITKRGLPARDK